MPGLCRPAARRSSERPEHPQRFFAPLPLHENMVVMACGDHIGADVRVGKRPREGRSQPNCIEAGMNSEADPRPFARRADADGRYAIVLAYQRERVLIELRMISGLETVAFARERRLEIG